MTEKIAIPEDVILRFLNAVEGLFTTDPDWSVFDLDGAAEFYAAADMVPDPEAVKTRGDSCPECGESGYTDPLECSFCADPAHCYDYATAEAEGWFISQNGEGWRLERRDENPVFDGDPAAHLHVVRSAIDGDENARKALRWLHIHARDELDEILDNAASLKRPGEVVALFI